MSTKDPSNKTLAARAKANLTGPGISKSNRVGGHCAGYVRENIWQTYGAKSSHSSPAGLDAIDQFKWYKARGFAVPVKKGIEGGGSVVGDILYKFGGAHGHVGIRIPGNIVAENSSVHGVGASEDARGTRTLKQWGQIEGIIRLPDPKAK